MVFTRAGSARCISILHFESGTITHSDTPPGLHEALPEQWLDSLERIQEMDANVLVPGHGQLCDRSYIPEMAAFIRTWVNTVAEAIKKGMSLEEAQDRISLLDRYPMQSGVAHVGQRVQRMNVTRLYQVLKNS